MPTRCTPGASLRCVVLAAAALGLLAGCGGSSPASSATTPAQSASNAPGSQASARTSSDVVTNGTITHRPLHGTGGNQSNDDNPGKADSGGQPASGQSNPCKLVSRAQAQAILGRPLDAPVEAPLGPTCIYQPTGAKSFVTVALESRSFAVLEPSIRKRKRFQIDGHTAYCGDYGQQTTFVPLANGRVLSVTAPCAIGRLFATDALPRLKS